MGCDIHLVKEVRDGERWVATHVFDGVHTDTVKGHDWCGPVARARNYRRFAALAGVRGEGPEPRGIPANASETTMYLIKKWGEDGHSHSFMEVNEAAKIFAATHYGELDDFSKKYPESFFFNHDEHDGEARIVFWFDN